MSYARCIYGVYLCAVVFFGFFLDNRFTYAIRRLADGDTFQQFISGPVAMIYILVVVFIGMLPLMLAEQMKSEKE